MKNQQELAAIKVTEKFDKELLSILSKELKMIKNAKNKFLTSLDNNSDHSLMVA